MIVAALDTETTGFCEPEHRIVEAYVELIPTSGRQPVFRFNQRINPKRSIPAEASRVHGITLADLAGMPDWETVGPQLHLILNRADVIVAHNAQFDVEFLNMEFDRIGLAPLAHPVFCTMENGIWATPIGKKPSLQELCFACEVPYDPAQAHAADYDVQRMVECLFRGLDWGFFQLPNPARAEAA